jgi:hypothetical protein
VRLRGELEGRVGEQLLLELLVDLREHRLGASAIPARRHSAGPGEAVLEEAPRPRAAGRTATALPELSGTGSWPCSTAQVRTSPPPQRGRGPTSQHRPRHRGVPAFFSSTWDRSRRARTTTTATGHTADGEMGETNKWGEPARGADPDPPVHPQLRLPAYLYVFGTFVAEWVGGMPAEGISAPRISHGIR